MSQSEEGILKLNYNMLTKTDLELIEKKGLSQAQVEGQIKNFVEGFPPLKLTDSAREGNGILKLDLVDQSKYTNLYRQSKENKKIVKFIPASGAASRMFKALFAFISDYDGSEEAYEKFLNDQGKKSVHYFFKNIEKFAFYEDLKVAYQQIYSEALEEGLLKKNYVSILKALLDENGLNYGSLPKGLLKFHIYGKESRTPTEEHLVEGANYAVGEGNVTNLHFTVSPNHRTKFESHIDEVKGAYESKFGVTFDVSYSEQKSSTDTIAVDLENHPFRETDGSILFRPAGHGALLSNLNDLDADVVFIKNIDNVVPDKIKDETYTYKEVIAGLLIEAQEKTFGYLKAIESAKFDLDEIFDFIESGLSVIIPENQKATSSEQKLSFARTILDRPIRVCGMVKSEGDPGGGPFWVESDKGFVQLQVVETAQIDLDNSGQEEIFNSATHFNPVDLVCGIKDYQDNAFDLMKFRDPKTGFITEKSKDGKSLKAQELPGLWNGSMSDWNTLFVEVPIITFNPVKIVNDLVGEYHQ